MLELAAYGVKMHPRSIELGSLYNVPIRISSSFSDQIGTLVHGGITTMEFGIKVTGVAYDRNVSKITLRRLPDRPGVAALLFETLSDQGISVDTDADINIDMITTSEIRITCIVPEVKVEEGVRILHKTFGLEKA